MPPPRPPWPRQLLIWCLPPCLALLASVLWVRRKRSIDPADASAAGQEPPQAVEKRAEEKPSSSSSEPIDIVLPPGVKSAKTPPVVVSDQDLDKEVERAKAARKSSVSPVKKRATMPPVLSPDCVTEQLLLSQLKIADEKPPQKEGEGGAGLLVAVDEKVGLERDDSANHSPADAMLATATAMLASPSLSIVSDNHSEGSSDSGKGCSEVATPPSRTPSNHSNDASSANNIESSAGDSNTASTNYLFEFAMPQHLVGRLIGRGGCFVQQIKAKTRAQIVIKKHPEVMNTTKVCCVSGSQSDIANALDMIRGKFPVKRYPEMTLEPLSFLDLLLAPPPALAPPLAPSGLHQPPQQLELVEGVDNDTIVSCMLAPDHLFLQQPTHPTFPSLKLLTDCMNAAYDVAEVDGAAQHLLLPATIQENVICVAHSLGAWYRALIVSVDPPTSSANCTATCSSSSSCLVKFLDFGGYETIDSRHLRQIRADFLLLPFQAAECMLANVRPCGKWSEAAFSLVADLTRGAVVTTQVIEYSPGEGLPLVDIYVAMPQGRGVVFLNQQLVEAGFAEWVIAPPQSH